MKHTRVFLVKLQVNVLLDTLKLKLIFCEIYLHVEYCYKTHIWDKLFNNGPSKVCGRQPLRYLK